MEPAKPIYRFSKLLLLDDLLELAHVIKQSAHIRLNTSWRFLGDFERPLQERYWEFGMGAGRHEQSEVGVVVLLEDEVDYRFKFWQ